MGSKMGGTNEDRIQRESAVRDRMYRREKAVLNKNMGTSLKAMDREYAELKKKQSELKAQKSGYNNLNDVDEAVRKAIRRGASSRSNLAAASRQRLQDIYGAKAEDDGQTSQPGPSGYQPPAAPETIKKAKGKGQGKACSQDQVDESKPHTTQRHGVQESHQTDQKNDHNHDRHDDNHHEHAPRRDSHGHMVLPRKGRRESITGKNFNRDEMEEQQKILELFIHLVEKMGDTVFDPKDLSAKLKELTSVSTDKAVSTGGHNPGSHSGPQRPTAANLARLHEDPELMNEIQALLAQRKHSVHAVHPIDENDVGSMSSLHQHHPHQHLQHKGKRRLSGVEMLSDILDAYKSKYKEVTFDPLAMLNCGYLRLSKSNVKELERLCHEQGVDPGIHAHSDVEDFQLFGKDEEKPWLKK